MGSVEKDTEHSTVTNGSGNKKTYGLWLSADVFPHEQTLLLNTNILENKNRKIIYEYDGLAVINLFSSLRKKLFSIIKEAKYHDVIIFPLTTYIGIS